MFRAPAAMFSAPAAMFRAPAAFTSSEPDPTGAVAALAELGFDFGPSCTVSRTLLDTFDGRIHAARLRVELCECAGAELIVSGPDSVPAHLSVESMPRFATDLPPGPLRARLAAIIDVRALVPVVRITATRTAAKLCDRAAKTVAAAAVYENVRVDDRDDVDASAWVVEIGEVAGYAKRAGKARDELERVGLVRVGGDTLALAAAAAGVDLAGFSGSPTVPLDPAMRAIDGFRVVLANLADTVVANWEGTVDQIDPEFLHDLRVAVRRTRSVVAQGKRVLPPAVVAEARERFALLGTLTGPTRDLDVYLIEWRGYTAPLGAEVAAALEPVRAVLERRRQEAHTTLTEAMQSAEVAAWMCAWRTWLDGQAGELPAGPHADRPLGGVVANHIARAQANLVERGRRIRPDTPAEQIHDLRKDAKKLRYLLECFATLLPNRPRKSFVRRLKALQDNLGEHQDAEVHIAELRAISHELHERGASPDTMLAIGQLTERLDQRRLAERTEFTRRFAAYDTAATQRTLDAALDALT